MTSRYLDTAQRIEDHAARARDHGLNPTQAQAAGAYWEAMKADNPTTAFGQLLPAVDRLAPTERAPAISLLRRWISEQEPGERVRLTQAALKVDEGLRPEYRLSVADVPDRGRVENAANAIDSILMDWGDRNIDENEAKNRVARILDDQPDNIRDKVRDEMELRTKYGPPGDDRRWRAASVHARTGTSGQPKAPDIAGLAMDLSSLIQSRTSASRQQMQNIPPVISGGFQRPNPRSAPRSGRGGHEFRASRR